MAQIANQNTEASGRERRRFPRFEPYAHVQLVDQATRPALVRLINISAGGALIEFAIGCDPAVSVGDSLSLFVDLGRGDRESLTFLLEAETVRVGSGGESRLPQVAVRWSAIDAGTRAQLAAALEGCRPRRRRPQSEAPCPRPVALPGVA